MTTPLVNPFVDVQSLKSGADFLDELHQARQTGQLGQTAASVAGTGIANPYGDGASAQEPGTLKFAGEDQDTGSSGLANKYASAYNQQHKDDKDIQLTETNTVTPGSGGDGSFNANAALPGLNAEQTKNARLIAQVAISRGLGSKGALLGIMTALAESGLRNLNHGDRDSVGLFQQRTSQGWGSVSQIMDPTYSAGKFFDALGKVSGWDSLDPWVAAQKVQRSASSNGSIYKRQFDTASAAISAMFSGGGDMGAGSNAARPGSLAANVIAKAKTMLGTYYVWGGTTSRGVDCSGLIYYALNGAGFKIPRYRAVDYGKKVGTTVSMSQARPGDLVYWDEPGDTDHVGIYLGNGQAIQAPTTGQKVKISSLAGWAPTSIRRVLPDSAW